MQAARDGGVPEVVVTTDGADIAAEARRLGYTVVDRPADLATGDSRTVDAVLHVLATLARPGDTLVLLLQPTSPLRTGADMRAVLDRHATGDVGSTLTGCAAGHHPLKQLLVDDEGTVSPVRAWADLEAPRQQLPRALRPNGAVYVTATGDMAAAGSVLVPPLAVVEMPEERSLDVDTADDLAAARALVEGRTPGRGPDLLLGQRPVDEPLLQI
ncbi:MAG: acylneuraminate cytidylyltransferase [Actinomycetota bacterium]|nr:acylneuraminate cytidylyltransferase [Actinomycetota bacterium]